MFIRKVLLVTITVQIYFIVFVKGQALDTAYLYFDANSDVTCLPENVETVDMNKRISKYEKTINDHVISFYVCLEKFNFNVREDRADTLNVACLQQIEFSNIEDMLREMRKEAEKVYLSYLYPDSFFKEIYIIEKINDRQVVKYDVFWQYYIE